MLGLFKSTIYDDIIKIVHYLFFDQYGQHVNNLSHGGRVGSMTSLAFNTRRDKNGGGFVTANRSASGVATHKMKDGQIICTVFRCVGCFPDTFKFEAKELGVCNNDLQTCQLLRIKMRERFHWIYYSVTARRQHGWRRGKNFENYVPQNG